MAYYTVRMTYRGEEDALFEQQLAAAAGRPSRSRRHDRATVWTWECADCLEAARRLQELFLCREAARRTECRIELDSST
jgi:hypothetical protein